MPSLLPQSPFQSSMNMSFTKKLFILIFWTISCTIGSILHFSRLGVETRLFGLPGIIDPPDVFEAPSPTHCALWMPAGRDLFRFVSGATAGTADFCEVSVRNNGGNLIYDRNAQLNSTHTWAYVRMKDNYDVGKKNMI